MQRIWNYGGRPWELGYRRMPYIFTNLFSRVTSSCLVAFTNFVSFKIDNTQIYFFKSRYFAFWGKSPGATPTYYIF